MKSPKSILLLILYVFCFIAGVFCAIVSHPADTVVPKLNNDVGSSPLQAARDLGMQGNAVETIKLSVSFSDHPVKD